nr:restriction endonuclease subunit S [uncultured Neisseria sp.]
MNKQQEPRLRFQGFTGAWEENVLEEVVNFFSGLTYSPNDVVKNGTLVLRSSNVQDNQITTEDNVFVKESAVNCQNVEVGDVIVVVRNGSRSLIGKHAIIKEKMPNTVIGAFMTGVRSNQPDFLNALLDSYKFNQEIEKNLGATINQITTGAFRKMEFSLPSLPEQTHLGLFFRRLDSQIAESRAVLEKSRQLKKAMLAKMFPANGEKIPKTRFKGFEGEWREWKLGAFGKATSGTSLESEFCEDGNYKVISIGSYSEKSTYTDQGIRTHKNDKTEKRILNKNDLTMILNDKTSSGRIIGRVLLIDQNDTYVYNQRTQRIEIDQEHFIPLFLYHLLNAENMRQKIIYSAQGNTQIYVNWSGIKNLEYLIPPTKAEQAAIGNFFRQLDETIALQSAEVEKLNQIKKGLLAAMLV